MSGGECDRLAKSTLLCVFKYAQTKCSTLDCFQVLHERFTCRLISEVMGWIDRAIARLGSTQNVSLSRLFGTELLLAFKSRNDGL